MITRRIVSILALLALTIPAASASATTPPPTSAAVRLAVSTARVVCGTVPRRKFARDYHMRTTSPRALAHRYARAYDRRMRARVEAACYRAMTKR